MKNKLLYKFLLPLSTIMLVVGAIIFFVGYIPGSNLSFITGWICVGFLFFGFIFFIISLVNLSFHHKSVNFAEERASPVRYMYSVFKYIGIIVIVIITICSIFIFYALISVTE